MQPRNFHFPDYDSIAVEVDRLHQGGYEKTGQWDLGQTCDHLRYFMEGSLDGHPYKVPWLLKVLFGRMVLRNILKTQKMKSGSPTPQKPLPEPGGDETIAVARFKEALERVKNHPGEFHASPFFGYLTPQQWRDLHRIHCAHHLGFLIPHGQ